MNRPKLYSDLQATRNAMADLMNLVLPHWQHDNAYAVNATDRCDLCGNGTPGIMQQAMGNEESSVYDVMACQTNMMLLVPKKYCAACFPAFPSQITDFVGRIVGLGEALTARTSKLAKLRSARQRIREKMDRIGAEHRRARFRGWEACDATSLALRDQVRNWATRSEARLQWPMVYLFGDAGVGKSHLAVAAARRIGYATRSFPKFVSETAFHEQWIRSHRAYDRGSRYHGPTPEQVVAGASRAEVLIWDDLGIVPPTPAWESLLMTVFSHRWAHRLPTLVTSNLLPANLSPRVGKRTADRVTSGAILNVVGQSRRGFAA